MSDYIIAPIVSKDLAGIWQHIAEDNFDAADRVIDSIHAAFGKLAELPGMGYRRADLNNEDLRVWPVFSYLIIYRYNAVPLEIIRVVSGSRDVAALMMQ